MKTNKKFRLEWAFSLLNKYSHIVIEKELEHRKLTKTQVMFIIHLKQKKGMHQDKLAEIFKTNRATVTRAINYLVAEGYVEKVKDEKNKKANIVSLSQLGEEVFIEINKAIMFWLDLITEDFSEEEIKLSIKLVSKMAANAGVYLGDHELSKKIISN